MGAPKGNDNRAKGKAYLRALNRAMTRIGSTMEQVDDETPKERVLIAVANQLVREAINGERWAMEELANRVDGKPAQQTILTGADDGPIQVESLTQDEINERITRLAGELGIGEEPGTTATTH